MSGRGVKCEGAKKLKESCTVRAYSYLQAELSPNFLIRWSYRRPSAFIGGQYPVFLFAVERKSTSGRRLTPINADKTKRALIRRSRAAMRDRPAAAGHALKTAAGVTLCCIASFWEAVSSGGCRAQTLVFVVCRIVLLLKTKDKLGSFGNLGLL